MKKRLTHSILALVIGSAILLSSCGDESEKSSDSESSEALSSDIQTSEGTSEVVEQSEPISEDISPDISDDISEAVSEPISEDVSEAISEDVSADISDIIVVPDGFKGHLMGDALALMDSEKGFGVSFSGASPFGEVDVEVGLEAYAKGDLMYAEMRLMFRKMTFIAKGGETYEIDVKEKKYQASEETVADIFEMFDISEQIGISLIYVDTVEETVDGVTYVVERYKEANKAEIFLKGYFKDNKLQMMCDSDGNFIKISITDEIPEDILSFPNGYSEFMPGDCIAVPDEYKDTSIGKILSRYNGEDGFVMSMYETDDGGQLRDLPIQTFSIKGDKVRSDFEIRLPQSHWL